MKYILSRIYAAVLFLRRRLYRSGILKRRTLPHPVISVGNLTVGGTGKTPFVVYLARLLQEANYKTAVLSRGYRGRAENSSLLVSDGSSILCEPTDSGDEPYLLASKLPGVAVAVGKNRYRVALDKPETREADVYLLDDGFQHIKLKRNLDILLWDAAEPLSRLELLPAGRLREPFSAIERADLVVVTHAHLTFDYEALERQIRRHNKIASISYFHHDAVGIYDLKNEETYRVRDFFGKRVIALAAIGNPEIFVEDLAHYQIEVVDQALFRDHHNFRQGELDDLLKRLDQGNAEGLMTTEKDAVRLRALDFPQEQIFVFQIEFRPEDAADYQKSFLSEMENLPEAH